MIDICPLCHLPLEYFYNHGFGKVMCTSDTSDVISPTNNHFVWDMTFTDFTLLIADVKIIQSNSPNPFAVVIFSGEKVFVDSFSSMEELIAFSKSMESNKLFI